MAAWVCVCGHNRSRHRLAWNAIRGDWDTSCDADTVTDYPRVGGKPCGCGEFRPRED